MAIGTLMCIDSPNDSREYDLFGIGGFEFVIIIVFALFIFGPDKLPEIGKNVGKALKMFNKAKNEFESVVKTDILKPEDMKAVRDMQDDLQSITSAVKNPMSLLNTNSSETAARVKRDMEKTAGETKEQDADLDADAEVAAADDKTVEQTPQESRAEVCIEADDVSDENVEQTPQQARANTPQRSEDVSARHASASAEETSSVAQDIWAATTDTIAEEN